VLAEITLPHFKAQSRIAEIKKGAKPFLLKGDRSE